MLNAMLSLKPFTWTEESYTNRTYCLNTVPKDSSEFNDVIEKCALAKRDQITIERVQHAFGYAQYLIRKLQLKNRQHNETIPEYTIFLKIKRSELEKALKTNLDARSVTLKQIEIVSNPEPDYCVIVAKSLHENFSSLERNSEIYPEYIIYFYYNHTPFASSKSAYDPHVDLQTTQAHSSVRSVTEIMKSLEEELANNHISDVTNVVEAVATSNSRKPAEEVSVNRPADSPDNPFGSLNTEQKDMAVAISKMGFPLPRVARACVALDGNQKKIVEHLLAMSDLLDLGFSEQTVVTALLKCDNHRDKALDLLIT